MASGKGKGKASGRTGFNLSGLLDTVVDLAETALSKPAFAPSGPRPAWLDWRTIRGNDPRDSIPVRSFSPRVLTDSPQDFSHAGYRSCTAPLPLNRSATVTIPPTGRNQFAELQAALEAGHLVQLPPGRYILDSDQSLLLTRPGSGLRGAGPEQTVIEVHGPRRQAIRIGVENPCVCACARPCSS